MYLAGGFRVLVLVLGFFFFFGGSLSCAVRLLSEVLLTQRSKIEFGR